MYPYNHDHNNARNRSIIFKGMESEGAARVAGTSTPAYRAVSEENWPTPNISIASRTSYGGDRLPNVGHFNRHARQFDVGSPPLQNSIFRTLIKSAVVHETSTTSNLTAPTVALSVSYGSDPRPHVAHHNWSPSPLQVRAGQPEIRDLPWHAINLSSNANNGNTPLFGTVAMRKPEVRGPRRTISSQFDLYNVYGRLVGELKGFQDSPMEIDDLLFVRKIEKSMWQSTNSLMYRRGNIRFVRLNPKERDEAVTKYIAGKPYAPKTETPADAPSTSVLSVHSGTPAPSGSLSQVVAPPVTPLRSDTTSPSESPSPPDTPTPTTASFLPWDSSSLQSDLPFGSQSPPPCNLSFLLDEDELLEFFVDTETPQAVSLLETAPAPTVESLRCDSPPPPSDPPLPLETPTPYATSPTDEFLRAPSPFDDSMRGDSPTPSTFSMRADSPTQYPSSSVEQISGVVAPQASGESLFSDSLDTSRTLLSQSLYIFVREKRREFDQFCSDRGIQDVGQEHHTENFDILLKCAETINDEEMVGDVATLIDKFWRRDFQRPMLNPSIIGCSHRRHDSDNNGSDSGDRSDQGPSKKHRSNQDKHGSQANRTPSASRSNSGSSGATHTKQNNNCQNGDCLAILEDSSPKVKSLKQVAFDRDACNAAAQAGNLALLQQARDEGCPWDTETCEKAAENGHLAVLRWAHEQGCPWDVWTCAAAAKHGQMDVLQWLHENDCPWDERTCAFAAENGHIETLVWARDNGCPWDQWTCTNAAKNGHLHILQWARENGCTWNSETCSYAAMNGHIDVLQWARTNGCIWNSQVCSLAIEHNHLDIYTWAMTHGCPQEATQSHALVVDGEAMEQATVVVDGESTEQELVVHGELMTQALVTDGEAIVQALLVDDGGLMQQALVADGEVMEQSVQTRHSTKTPTLIQATSMIQSGSILPCMEGLVQLVQMNDMIQSVLHLPSSDELSATNTSQSTASFQMEDTFSSARRSRNPFRSLCSLFSRRCTVDALPETERQRRKKNRKQRDGGERRNGIRRWVGRPIAT